MERDLDHRPTWVGQRVLASGQLVGYVVAILEAQGAEFLHVRRLGAGGDDLYIPRAAIARVRGNQIFLTVRWGSLAGQAWHLYPAEAAVLPSPALPAEAGERGANGAHSAQLEGELLGPGLTAAERALLLEILLRSYGELKAEIYKTETAAFQRQLVEREAMLAGLLRKLGYTGRLASE